MYKLPFSVLVGFDFDPPELEPELPELGPELPELEPGAGSPVQVRFNPRLVSHVVGFLT